MTHDKLPEEIRDRIIFDAEKASNKRWPDKEDHRTFGLKAGYEVAYIAGATAWAPWKVKYDEAKRDFDSIQKSAIHYANRKDEVEKERNELQRHNDRLKEAATGWRPLLEDILRDNDSGYIDIDDALYLRIKKFLYGE